ncbi:MAG: NAD(P)/FAD-dependent oxidoreductase, partial [Candidatus Dadabacteria bacterium]
PEHYASIGIDLRLKTAVTGIDLKGRTVSVGADKFPWDRLIVATGWEYDKPDIPGIDLEGIHYIKNIRRAMEFDKILDGVKKVVVVGATPLGIEISGNLAHRGIETHLVDEGAWLMSEVADPDIMEPVQKSLEEFGTIIHFGEKVLEFRGTNGKVSSAGTTGREIDCDVAIIATHKKPNNRISREAGLEIG